MVRVVRVEGGERGGGWSCLSRERGTHLLAELPLELVDAALRLRGPLAQAVHLCFANEGGGRAAVLLRWPWPCAQKEGRE